MLPRPWKWHSPLRQWRRQLPLRLEAAKTAEAEEVAPPLRRWAWQLPPRKEAAKAAEALEVAHAAKTREAATAAEDESSESRRGLGSGTRH